MPKSQSDETAAAEGSRKSWLEVLEESEALLRGHFRLSSGLHSPVYVQCARLLEIPPRAREVGEALAAAVVERVGRPGSVVGPALGAVIVGHEVAAALGVPFRFTERGAEGRMELRRGFALGPGERVVVVEDAVTTGRSTRETMEVVRAAGAEVVAVAAILDRNGGAGPFDVPFVRLAELSPPTYRPEECPMCAAGGAAEKPGSRPDAG